ncbi:unnamed protein product [Rotaria sordida]|uniref:Uncharacterized protein n=1 Tax=Rotaria sordida TaxID=392033 RepID=A0A819SZG5_9BILA|nr:unnamed protein product [Rotaria sordida]CAF1495012.1 unnamed protein product [Rotaria sordida]CAF4025575.1 unnamed protein product [Rotaria sordida]CAF4070170.1 unnamed protein product [Rotaria sordida]
MTAVLDNKIKRLSTGLRFRSNIRSQGLQILRNYQQQTSQQTSQQTPQQRQSQIQRQRSILKTINEVTPRVPDHSSPLPSSTSISVSSSWDSEQESDQNDNEQESDQNDNQQESDQSDKEQEPDQSDKEQESDQSVNEVQLPSEKHAATHSIYRSQGPSTQFPSNWNKPPRRRSDGQSHQDV